MLRYCISKIICKSLIFTDLTALVQPTVIAREVDRHYDGNTEYGDDCGVDDEISLE